MNTIIQITEPIRGGYDERWAQEITRRLNQLISGKAPFGPIRIGFDNVNQTVFETDGSFGLNGTATVFDDLVAAISGIQVLGTGVSVNTTEQTIEFTTLADLNDYAWTAYQLRHAWKPGSVIQPHIHWEQTSANIPNFLMRYRWQKNGGTKTTAWTDYKCNTAVFTYVSGTLNQICSGTGITPPVGYSISDIVQFRVFRDNANTSTVFTGADGYTGTCSITSLDCHLELNRMGSRTEYAV